jgi:MYXO-CTERM domain-containing protein
VSVVTLLAVRDASGWHVDAEVEGTGVTSASFAPPGRPLLDLPCDDDPDVVLCEREEPAPPSAGYASLAALLAAFPAGSWQLAVNGGALTATLPFDPVEPDGVVTVTDPADGAAFVGATPDVSYANACTACPFIELRIEDAPTQGLAVEIETLVSGAPPLPPGQVPFAEFFDETPVPLPAGAYRIVAGAALGSLTTTSFDQGGGALEFSYGRGAELQTVTTFTVPEPDAAMIAAIAGLGAFAWRRRRHEAR